MKSRFECLVLAERCERMAHESREAVNRRVLLDVARAWRRLAERDKEREPLIGPPHLPPAAGI